MNKKVSFFMYLLILSIGYPLVTGAGPLIVDHNCVNLFTNLTAADTARVKTLWISIAGESHSKGYRIGCQLLMNQDSRFQVAVQESGTPEGATEDHLRISSAMRRASPWWVYGCGEAGWYTSTNEIEATKIGLAYCATNGPRLDVLGFGWCWDMSWHNGVGGGINTAYSTRWAGSSEGGPDGDLRWGLTAADYPLTGNRVCMDTYLNATEQYRSFCRTNGYPTKVIFTTGPVDGLGGNESSYQVSVKNQYIRDYVSRTTNGILFDYADILCWDNAGVQKTASWQDFNGVIKTFPIIADDNMRDLNGSYAEDGDHIGQRGALRLAKALWWMLAVITEPPPKLYLEQSDSSSIIRFNGIPCNIYEILYTHDLCDPHWLVLGTFMTDEHGKCQFIDSLLPGTKRRFYRQSYR